MQESYSFLTEPRQRSCVLTLCTFLIWSCIYMNMLSSTLHSMTLKFRKRTMIMLWICLFVQLVHVNVNSCHILIYYVIYCLNGYINTRNAMPCSTLCNAQLIFQRHPGSLRIHKYSKISDTSICRTKAKIFQEQHLVQLNNFIASIIL